MPSTSLFRNGLYRSSDILQGGIGGWLCSEMARCLTYVRKVINSERGQDCSKQSGTRMILEQFRVADVPRTVSINYA